ncbi:MAG: hypothetical protein SFV21_11405 [Rhodospirillaceae bacterium]|nr:hypothetical protein [Rhodospirillaceae bacterium]
MMDRRSFLACFAPRRMAAAACALGLGAAATPALAQEIPQFGIPIPWFRSRAEKLARAACENNLPECRADVRRQLEAEKQVSLVTPWILLCVAVLGVLLILRKREKDRARQREEARRKHVPGAFKTLDQTRADRQTEPGDDRF